METFQVELPLSLAQRIRHVARSHDALNRVMVEALQNWLAHEDEGKADRETVLKALRAAGLVMSSERQRAFAESMITMLPPRVPPSRTEVEAALAKLKVPLSEEIIAMRGER